MSQHQVPAGMEQSAFTGGAYVVMNTTKQEQIPGAAYLIEGTSIGTTVSDQALYYYAT